MPKTTDISTERKENDRLRQYGALTAKLEWLEASEANRVAWCQRHRVNPDTGDLCGNYKAAIATCKEAIAKERKLAECQ